MTRATTAIVNTLTLPHANTTWPGLPRLAHWLGLAALVLLLHAWVLSGDLSFTPEPPPPPTGGFQTRSLPAPVATPAAAPVPTTPARAAPSARVVPPSPKKIAAAKPAVPPQTTISPEPKTARGESDNTRPAVEPEPDQAPNQPVALEESAQTATVSIAPTESTRSESTAAVSAPSSAASTGAPSYILGPINLPPPQTLNYAVSALYRGQNLNGQAVLSWQHDGQQYALTSSLDLSVFLGSVRLLDARSSGKLGPYGLMPERYTEKNRRSEQATHFEADKAQIVFANNRPTQALSAGAQDRFSAALQLASLFSGAADKYPSGSSIRIQVAGVREAGPWDFQVMGSENIERASGTLSAIRLLRSPRRDYDTELELWLAPDLGYLPARMKVTQANGDTFDQVLR